MSVTLVGGNQQGLLDTSLMLLDRNERTSNDMIGSGESLYVNVANGNLVIQHRDAYMPSLGGDFDLVRTYNSRGSTSDAHQYDGARWTSSTGVRLNVLPGFPRPSFTVEYGDGSTFDYHWDSARNLYVSTDGAGAFETIQDLGFGSGPRWLLTRADQSKLYFDDFGQLERWEDTNGVRMEYSYAADRLVRVRDDSGHVINYIYDFAGRLFRVTDESEQVLVEYHYAGNLLTEVIDRMGHSTRFFYTAGGLLERIELPYRQRIDGNWETYQQREIRIEYDNVPGSPGAGPVVSSVTDAEGGVTTFDYDFDYTGGLFPEFDGGTTTVVDALGNRRAYSNEQQYIDWRVANGFYTIFNQGSMWNPSYVAQVNAIRTAHSLSYSYQANGYIESLRDQQGYLTDYDYDGQGNLTSVTDRNGWAVRNSDSSYYRSLRAQLGIVDASGNGKLVATLTAAERNTLREAFTSHFRYDTRGNLLEAEDNNGSITSFTYTSFNKVATTTAAMGHALTTSNAQQYQEKRVALGYAALVADLSAANIAALRALYTTTFTYDTKQNLIEQRAPGGDLTRYEYDANGNQTRRIVFLDAGNLTDPALQQVTQYFYDGFGNNIETVDPEGNHTLAQYDHFGNLTRFTDGKGGITSYTYDKDNRLLLATDPEGHTTVNTYDAVGNRISVTDAKGHTVLRFYDRNNRLITVLDPSATAPAQNRTTRYAYDVVGNQTSVTDAEGRKTTYVYNARRELVEALTAQVSGADGSPVQYESSFSYDGEGNVITSTNNRGFVTALLYNEDGLVSRRTDPNGHITQYTYDANNNQVMVVAGLQLAASQRRVLRFAFDEEDQVATEIDAEGFETQYTRDAVGNVIARTDANGHTAEYRYDRNNRLVREIRPEVIDPRTGLPTQYVVEHRYDANGNEVELIDENGHSVRYSFDRADRVVLIEDANGIKTAFTYDANDNRTSVQIGVQATVSATGQVTITDDDQAQVTTFVYDEFNQLISSTDGVGNALVGSDAALYQQMRTELGYAATVAGLSAADKAALRALYTTRISYDRVGNFTSRTDNLGRVTQFAYDALNRLERTTDALGGVSSQRYDGNDNVVSVTNANGKVTTFAYDSVDRQTSSTDAIGVLTQQSYDDFGNLLSETRAAGTADARTTQYVYDLNQRLVSMTDPLGHAQSYEYDAVGNRLRVTDGSGYTTHTHYDALDRVVSISDPEGFETRFEYDGADNRIAIVDARGGITRFTFDAGDRLIETTDAEGRLSSYAYDVRGNNIQLRTAVGTSDEQLTTFEYDAEKNLRRVTDAEGHSTTHDYDRVYNRVATVDGNGHISVSEFDALDRLLRVTNAAGEVTSYQYDALSNRLSKTDGNGHVTQWVYDDISRVTREIAADGVETHYVYDALSNRTSITQAANTAAASTTTFTYDSDDRLIAQTDALGHTIGYTYDANGNRTSVTDAGGHTTAYTYDRNNRVTHIEDGVGNVVEYRYDGNGNRVQVIDGRGFSTTSYYNANNEIILQVDPQGYASSWQYDGNGNVLAQRLYMQPLSGTVAPGTWPEPSGSPGDRFITFEYDRANRVTARTDGEDYRTEYVYDAVGNRIETRQQLDQSGTRVAVTRSFFDAVNRETDRLSAEGYLTRFSYDAAGNVVSRTIFNERATLSGGLPVPAAGDAGRVTQYQYNQVNRLSSETSALGVVTQYEYDARGNRTATIDAFGTSDARRSEFTFDAANRLTDVRDAAGIVTHYVLDADGNITDQYDAYGTAAQRHTQRAYDGNHRMVSETNALGIVTALVYDANGNVTSKTTARGTAEQRVETFEYDRNGRLIAQVNGEGERTENVYDGAGNRIRVTVAPGLAEQRVNTFEFDKDNRLVLATDGEGVRTAYIYDGAGNKIETIQAQGLAGQERHSFYDYDLDNRLTQVTDPLDGTTLYEYDVLGNQTRIENANGGVQVNTFDALGRLLTSLSAGGTLTVNTYDLRGNVTSTTQSFADGSDARTTRYGYDLLDHQIAVTDGEGYTTSIGYDAFGNQVAVTIGQYLVASGDPAYDAAKAARAHAQSNTFSFDAANRMLSMTDGEGNVTTYGYDAVGNRISVTEASNTAPRTTQYGYDRAGRLIETITPEGGITRSDYDAAGNKVAEHILQSVNGGANVWIDRSFEYDGNARLTASIDAYGVRTEFELDAMGNVTVTRTAAGTADERVTRKEYDLNNRKTADIDGEGNRTQYVYDAMGNRTRVIDALGRAARYYFDGANRLVAVLDPEGAVNTFTYDSAGNSVQQNMYATRHTGPISNTTPPVPVDSVNDRTLTTNYDRAGRAISVVEPDGTTTEKTYDGAGNVLTERLFANTTAPRTRSYTYDLNNRLEQFTDVDGTVTHFTWDGANNKTSERLVSSTDPNAVRETVYAYDLNNRLVTRTFDPSGLDLVESSAYDKAGNVIATTDANGHTTTFVFDSANRVASETNALGHTIAYGYDAVGNRTSVTDARNVTRTFVYDDNNRVIEERGPSVQVFHIGDDDDLETRTLVTRHVYDAFGNEVQTIDPEGYRTTRYFDGNGRRTAEISADNVLTEWRYDTFGSLVRETLYMSRLTSADHVPTLYPTAPSGEARTKETTYDLMGRVVRTLHPAVEVTSVSIDANGQPVSSTVTTRPEERAIYDDFGNAIETVDRNGNHTFGYYDVRGRLIAQVDAEGYMTEWQYDAQDNVLEQSVYADPLASVPPHSGTPPVPPGGEVHQLSRRYDAASRLIAEYTPFVDVVDSAGVFAYERVLTTYTYDGAGNQTSRTNAAGTSQATTEYYYFDAANRRIAVINASRVVHTYDFDANGNITRQKRYFNALGSGVDLAALSGDTTNFATLAAGHANDQTTERVWDVGNRMTSETDLMSADGGADDITKRFRYNANGAQTWVRDAANFTSQFDYDRVGRLVTNIAPDGTGSRIEYDAAGNQIFLYTGQIDNQAQPATNITASFGGNLVIGWDVPSTGDPGQSNGSRSWLVWDSTSRADLASYASRSEELATWFSGHGELYIPANALGAGDQVYFRVVTADRAGNLAYTAEQVVRIPPRLESVAVTRTGSDSARVVVDAVPSATDLVIHYGAPGSLSNTLTLTLRPDGKYAADLTGITNLSELSYRISWEDAAGNSYQTSEQTFRASDPHLAVTTTVSETTVSGGFNVNLSTRVPVALASDLSSVAATLQSLDNPNAAAIEAEVTGTANADGTWTYSLVLGSTSQTIPAGNYRVVLSGVYAAASEITAASTLLDQFDITLGGTPLSGTRQSLSWTAPSVGDPGTRHQLVIVDGVSVPTLRDTASQQLIVPVTLNPGSHTYDALYGERFGADHSLELTSTEITEEVPDPNDPDAPPTVNILGYDVNIALTLDASETANVTGGLHLAWRPAGSGLSFANDVVLTASGNQFATTLDEIDAGNYDLKLYYLDADGNEVIVDWLRIDAKTATLTRTGRSLTVLASETGGSISATTGNLPTLSAGIFSGPTVDERNYLRLDPTLTGRPEGVVDSDGRTAGYFTENVYNALNQLIATNSETGLWREFGVDANGNKVVTRLYGEQGNTEVHDSYALFDGRNRKVAEYSAATNVYGSSTAQRAVTEFGYDAFDHEVSVTDSLGHTIQREFNALGLLVREQDRRGGVTEHLYDRLGNETVTRDPLYDSGSPLSHATRMFYDAAGRLIREINGDGDVKEYRYDAFDRRIELRLAGASKTISHTMSYDHRDRLISYVDGEQLTTNFQYDKRDNRTGIQNARGYWTYQDYDGLNRVTQTRYQQNGQTITEQRQYDAYGNLVAEVDGAGRTRSTVYGAFGRKIAEIDAAGRELRYEYDDFGNIIREYRPAAQATSNTGWNQELIDQYGYWGYVELIEQWNQSGASGSLPDIRREYDAAGRLTRVRDLATGVSTTYQYDLNGNRKAEDITTGTLGHDRHLVYTYDAADQMVRWADSQTGMHLNYVWDAAGYQERVYTDAGYANAVDHWYDYDGANRVISITNGNGGSIVSAYDYDEFGNRHIWNNAGVIVTYQFDNNGRVTAGEWNEGGAHWTSDWDYDAAGNLTSYVTRKNGSVETTTTNQYSENNLTTYSNSDGQETRNTFDAGQRLTGVQLRSDGKTTTYTYHYFADGRERQILGSGNKNAKGTTTFSYDANDKQVRIEKGKGDGMDRNELMTLVYNNDGQILYRFHDEGSDSKVHSTEFQYANGHPVGEKKTQDGTVTELLDSGKYNLVQNLGEDFPLSAVSATTVLEGDTLQSIAARVYGNPSLWFILAEANGLSPGEPLKAGTRLNVPSTVESGALTADAHRVYDEGDIIGSTLPNLKTPKKKGCGNILAIIIVVVIAIVVSYFVPVLAGYFAGVIGGLVGGVTAGTVAAGLVTVASYAVAGAVLGAAASIVQQGLFIALDYQDSFSWKDVAAGAVAGAISGAAQGVGALNTAQLQGIFGSVQHAKIAVSALRVASAASRQLITSGKITSWSSLAVAGLQGAAGFNSRIEANDRLAEAGQFAATADRLADAGDSAGTQAALIQSVEAESAAARLLQTAAQASKTVDMLSPWLSAAETYIRGGELKAADWISTVGDTVGSAVAGGNGNSLSEQLKESAMSLGRNLLFGGVIRAFDKEAGQAFIENAIGQEVGAFIGQQAVGALVPIFTPMTRRDPAAILARAQENEARNNERARMQEQAEQELLAATAAPTFVEPQEQGAEVTTTSPEAEQIALQPAAKKPARVARSPDQVRPTTTAVTASDSAAAELALVAQPGGAVVTSEVDERAQALAEFRETLNRVAAGIEATHRAQQEEWDKLSWLDKGLVTIGSGFNSLWEGVKGIGNVVMSGIEAYGNATVFMAQLGANTVRGDVNAVNKQVQGAAAGIQKAATEFKDDALAAMQMIQDISSFIASEPEAQKALLEFGKRVGNSIGSAQVATLVGDIIVTAAVTAVTAGAGGAVRAANVGGKLGEAANAVLGLISKVGKPGRGLSMNSSSLGMGVEKASGELLEKVAKKRTVVFAKEGSEDLKYLDWMGAEANVGGANYTHILLRPNPSKAAVLEEFLHGTQSRIGIIDKLGTRGLGSAETHVKDFMIRHQRLLGLGAEDVKILQQLKDAGL